MVFSNGKVFCGSCRFYKDDYWDAGCRHPSNTKFYDVSSHAYAKTKKEYVRSPKELNKENDCSNWQQMFLPLYALRKVKKVFSNL